MSQAYDRSSRPSTLFEQLYERLLKRVAASPANTPMLSERKLAARYDVSHSTVRRVMNRLQDEGHIYKVHGGGCFVADRKLDETLALRTVVYVDTDEVTDSHPYFARRLNGMLDSCMPCGFRLQILRLNDVRFGGDAALLSELKRDEVVGVIVPWMNIGILKQIREINPQVQVVTSATRYPPTGVASVFPDYGAAGYLAAQVAASHGCRGISLVHTQPETLAGAYGYRAKAQAVDELDIAGFSTSLEADAAALATQVADAGHQCLAFDDSAVTKPVLAELKRRYPDFLEGCTVVSHANHGDVSLPADVVRLETDGYALGVNLIETLEQVIKRGSVAACTKLIAPTLIEPNVEGI